MNLLTVTILHTNEISVTGRKNAHSSIFRFEFRNAVPAASPVAGDGARGPLCGSWL